MDFSDIPFWVYIVCGLFAVLTGRGIRMWLDRRKALEENERKERQKSEKAQRKHNMKMLKKARKNTKST